MRWLAAAGLSCLCFCAAALGTFVPLRGEDGDLQHLYAWPGGSTLALAALAIVLLLSILFAIVTSLARRTSADAAARAASGRWLSPLTLLGAVLLGVLPAMPGASIATTPAGYFFFDLRWWWLGGAIVLVLVAIDPLVGEPAARRLRALVRLPPRSRGFALDALLCTTVIACAIASTPRLRFTSELHGDEPKYIRYCELWYQGGGFDISAKTPIDQLAPGSAPALHRIPGLLMRAFADDAHSLAGDLAAFAADPRGFRWNRASGEEGFVRGWRGGVYQIYQPGVSFALFPGYALDRLLSPAPSGYQGEFAPSLVATNLVLVVMFAGCAVALQRLLRRTLGSDVLATVWSAAAMLTMPTTAFAFQFYPELPGLFLIVLVSTYVLFTASDSSARVGLALAAGAGAAGLAWLHPRFLLVSALLALCGLARSTNRARLAFAGAAGAVYVSVLWFNYHVTGSFLPTALWDAARPAEGFGATRVPLNFAGYALDRTWGLAPHAPLLLAAVPGLAVLARGSWTRAAFVAGVCLALVIPASGHTLSAAGGTPSRLIVAIVPILVWPVALLVRRFWGAWPIRAFTVVALVLSLDAGLAYNWNHEKAFGALRAQGASGWRPNLAFPVIRDVGWETSANFALFLALVAAVGTAAALAFVRSGRPGAAPSPSARPSPGLVVAVGALTAVSLATAATAANRDWFRDEYLLGRATARRVAAAGLLALERCRVCMTSRDRTFDWTDLQPNPARGIISHVEVQGLRARIAISIESAGGWTGFGRMRADFGDQSGTLWTPVVGEWQLTHDYRQPGEYLLTIFLQLRDGTPRIERRAVIVPDVR